MKSIHERVSFLLFLALGVHAQLGLPPTLPTTTSSFDWWPYPPGGVATTTPAISPSTFTMAPDDLDPADPTGDSGDVGGITTTITTTTASSSPNATSSTDSIIRITAPVPTGSSAGPMAPPRGHIATSESNPLKPIYLLPLVAFVGLALGILTVWGILRCRRAGGGKPVGEPRFEPVAHRASEDDDEKDLEKITPTHMRATTESFQTAGWSTEQRQTLYDFGSSSKVSVHGTPYLANGSWRGLPLTRSSRSGLSHLSTRGVTQSAGPSRMLMHDDADKENQSLDDQEEDGDDEADPFVLVPNRQTGSEHSLASLSEEEDEEEARNATLKHGKTIRRGILARIRAAGSLRRATSVQKNTGDALMRVRSTHVRATSDSPQPVSKVKEVLKVTPSPAVSTATSTTAKPREPLTIREPRTPERAANRPAPPPNDKFTPPPARRTPTRQLEKMQREWLGMPPKAAAIHEALPINPSTVTSPPLQSALFFSPSVYSDNGLASPPPIGNTTMKNDLTVESNSPTSGLKSPAERFRARREALSRVDEILARNWGSRDFDKMLTQSPTHFGADANAETPSQSTLDQRLAALRKSKIRSSDS